ncbi:MAG: hypothetical protein ACRDZW_07405 [Acidimicrobiales bacterium]
MAQPNPADIDMDDTEVEIEIAVLDADVSAALDYLCAHAGEWPGGLTVAARIARHRRRTAMPVARSARCAG